MSDKFEDYLQVYPKYIDFVEDMRQIVAKYDAKNTRFGADIWLLFWNIQEYNERQKFLD